MREALVALTAFALGCNPLVSLGDEYCFEESCQVSGASTGTAGTGSAGTGSSGTTGGSTAYRDLVLAGGPRLYYRLGEPTMSTTVASEVGGHGGTTFFDQASDVTFGEEGAIVGDANRATAFVGRGSLALDAPADFAGLAPHTIELFLKTTIASGEFLHPLNNVNQDVGWFLKLDVETLTYMRKNTGGLESRSTGWLSNGTWQHVVVVFDGAAVTFYARGAPTGPAQAFATSIDAYQATLRVRDGTQPVSTDVPSMVDELAIYDRALSWQEVCNHYRCSRDPAACENPTNACNGE